MASRATIFRLASGEPAASQVEPRLGGGVPREGSFPFSVGPFPGLYAHGVESAAILNTGAAANLACFRRLRRRNAVLAKFGAPIERTKPTPARLKFENARFAADVPLGTAGRRGTVTTFLLEADIPALIRKGALESFGKGNRISLVVVYTRKRWVYRYCRMSMLRVTRFWV